MKIKAIQYVKPYAGLENNEDGVPIIRTGVEFTRYELMYEENGVWVKVPVEVIEESE